MADAPVAGCAVTPLASMFAEYLEWRTHVARRCNATVDSEKRALAQFCASASPDGFVSLSLAAFPKVCEAGFRHLAPSTRALRERQVFAAWVWATDADPPYLGLAPAPRSRARCLSPGPVGRGVAPPTPTFEELDRCIRLVRVGTRVLLAIQVMRYTGLRISQVRAIRARDVDVQRGRLYVRTGKSAREKTGRHVPMCEALRVLLAAASDGKDPDASLVPLTNNFGVHLTLRRVFVAGGLPKETWSDIDGRRCMRLCHTFRATFQAELRRRGVADRVIDHLVGHTGATVRDRHYTSADWAELVAAVGQIPKLT
jgi:integrase